MPARLVTIAVTISVTMMLGRSMSSERARFSNVLSCIVIRQVSLVGGISLTRRIVVLERRGKPVWKPICRAPGGLVWRAAVLAAAAEGAWRAV